MLLQEQGIDPKKVPCRPESRRYSRSSQMVPMNTEKVHLQVSSSNDPDQNQYGNEIQSNNGQIRFKFVEK